MFFNVTPIRIFRCPSFRRKTTVNTRRQISNDVNDQVPVAVGGQFCLSVSKQFYVATFATHLIWYRSAVLLVKDHQNP